MVTPVALFIARTAGRPFEWGVLDCTLWPAQLVLERKGFDPASGLRGRYDTAFGARRIAMQAGGLRALVSARMGPTEALCGDGVCVARWSGQQICGIVSGSRLVLKTPGGVVLPDAYTILDFWAV